MKLQSQQLVEITQHFSIDTVTSIEIVKIILFGYYFNEHGFIMSEIKFNDPFRIAWIQHCIGIEKERKKTR